MEETDRRAETVPQYHSKCAVYGWLVGCVRSCKLLSAWVTVAITVERLIAVVHPLRVATLSTTRRARLVIVLLTLTCLVLAAFPLWTVGSQLFSGVVTCIKVRPSSYRSWLIAVVVVMSLTLPYCLLTVCTAVIIVFLSRSQHFRAKVSRDCLRTILFTG